MRFPMPITLTSSRDSCTDSGEWERETQMAARLAATCAGGPLFSQSLGHRGASHAGLAAYVREKSRGVLPRV